MARLYRGLVFLTIIENWYKYDLIQFILGLFVYNLIVS